MIQKNIELEKLIAQKNEGLLQINNELEEKIKQSDLFQSILVHDIKSPLRFIVSTSKLVLDFWPSVKDDIKKENISHIHESASKIKGFVNEALLWIQIRNGDHRTENNNFRVSTMLSENINLYREDSKIISGAITISMDCDPSLHVHTDKSLLSTIMRNLLANSIKYTDEGIITLYAYSKKKGDICVGCRDNGKGMSTAMIEKIMDDDYKGNSIRQDSFRMGYIIIKEITKLLGAQLTIQSKIDKGTDVWVVFSNQ